MATPLAAGCSAGSGTSAAVRYAKGPGMAFIERTGSCSSSADSPRGIPVIALIGAGCLVLLLLVILVIYPSTKPPGPTDSGSDDDWGTEPPRIPTPPTPPRGGVPLPDAQPASVRLRGRGRISRRRIGRRGPSPARNPGRLPARTRNQT